MIYDDLRQLHSDLTEAYKSLLAGGVEDARILKEIREFLNDNDINVQNMDLADNIGTGEIELDIDITELRKVK